MTLICFASQKGSPGATATALSVAASLKVATGRRKVLLEADTTGGTLAIRYRLPVEPGLLTLAAAVRGGLDNSDGLWRHAQELPGGLPVIVCPDGPEQVHAAMAAGGAQLGRFLNSLRDVDVMCDVGRLSPDSPALPFVAEASAVLMVARPTAEQLQPAARRMLMLRPVVSNLGWVLVGQKPYGPADVEATYDFPVVGVMADDPRSVQLLERGTVSKRLRRQPFIRSATTLAETLSGWLSPLTSAAVPAVSPAAASTTAAAVRAEPVAESVQANEVPAEVSGADELPQPDELPQADVVSAEVSETTTGVPAAPATGVSAQAEVADSEPLLVSEPAPAPETPPLPADVDLTLLPPPVGDPDPQPPHPVVPTAVDNVEVDVADRSSDIDEAGEAAQPAVALDVADGSELPAVAADWAPPAAPEPPTVPALASAPLVPAPDQDSTDTGPDLLSDETDPFPTESMRPVPPPPAPTGSRTDADVPKEPPSDVDQPVIEADEPSVELDEPSIEVEAPSVEADALEVEADEPVVESDEPAAEADKAVVGNERAEEPTNGFGLLAEPGGLGWDDLQPVLARPTTPPLPPAATQNGTAILNGAPPVPPPTLSLDGEPSPLNGAPPEPPPLLMIDPAGPAEHANNGGADADHLEEADRDQDQRVAVDRDETERDDDAGDREDNDWDGSEFTVTADLSNVFAPPDFDAPPIEEPDAEFPRTEPSGAEPLQTEPLQTEPVRTEPPMPPMASVPPLPPASTQLHRDRSDDVQQKPSPFPHEDSGADWTGW